MLLDVSHVSKSYPGLPVLDDVSFTLDEGEIVCLLGPSGCGKTTLLRLVAGLEAPDTGRISFAGQDLANVPVHRRSFGLMFQDYALFPHKDVAANVAFGLRMKGWPPDRIAARVQEMLKLVELSGYERRSVSELSGGEQQRVALARSLAPRPRLLMFDEPLGSLDRALREQLMNSLRGILKQVGVPALYVTHDQEEAFAIADRVFIMQPGETAGEGAPALRGGRIVQGGTPQEVYCRPRSAYVARFLGFRNLLPGTVLAIGAGSGAIEGAARSPSPSSRPCGTIGAPVTVETPIGRLIAEDNTSGSIAVGDQITLLIRPEAATILPEDATREVPNLAPGILLSASFRGSFYLLHTEHPGDVVLVSEAPATDLELPAAGSPLLLHLNPAAIALLR